jgi:hypothetical protein
MTACAGDAARERRKRLRMPMFGRLIMGALGLFMVWTLVRAWRSGIIVDNVWRFDADDNPVMYALEFASRIGLIVICAGCAAGYTPSQMFDVLGIGGLYSFFESVRKA